MAFRHNYRQSVCATEDTMAPSRQDPVTGADGCTRLRWERQNRSRHTSPRHLSDTQIDSGLRVPSVVGDRLLNTNGEVGTGHAAACNIMSG